MGVKVGCPVLLILVGFGSWGNLPAIADDSSDGRAILMLIAEEQQKNLDKLPPLKWSSIQWTKLLVPGRERESINERRMIRSGGRGWAEVTLRSRGFDGNPNGPWKVSTTVILWNEDYVAMFHKGTGAGYMWEYNSPETMSEKARRTIASAGSRPELHSAFGYLHRSLAELVADERLQSVRVEVTRESGSSEGAPYVVKLFYPNEQYAAIEWTVDPKQGYMIVRGCERDGRTGWKAKDYTIAGREIVPGAWFPTQWRRIYYGEPDRATGQQPIAKTYDWDVTDLEVDPEVPESQFNWTALGLEPDRELWRYDVSGDMTRMKMVNGELVPITLITDERE